VSAKPGREWAVCVYCASGPTHPELLTLARRVGQAIADRGWTLVSGGGNVSAMGALAAAARAHGGRTVGVIPKALVHREVADTEADVLVVTDTMRERKQVIEAWTAAYLGMHDKPIVMLDPFGHYDGLLTWLSSLVDRGYVAESAMDRLVVVNDLDAAMAVCEPPA
jgi:predicted Rossmann-fold nucleotide-binding protein